MTPKQLMALVDLVGEDAAGIDPAAIGVVVMVLVKDGDELGVRVGADVPPDIVKFAMHQLTTAWMRGDEDMAFVTTSRPQRKKVV